MVYLRGALIEYGSDFLGPIPNVVLFQFNPDTVIRSLQIPERPVGLAAREATQVGDKPIEKITLSAHFDAATLDAVSAGIAMAVGIGPQLAALEMMVRPKSKVFDAIAGLFSKPGGPELAKPIPREKYPRLLFVWGPGRILPVVIETMTITEQKFDFLLNPVRAEVALSLAVTIDKCSDDKIASGALMISDGVKEVLAATNLVNTVQQFIEQFTM